MFGAQMRHRSAAFKSGVPVVTRCSVIGSLYYAVDLNDCKVLQKVGTLYIQDL